MIVRAFKHILQAVIAAVVETGEMAISIAAALNMMLGVPESGDSNCSSNVHSLIWRWLEVFLLKRYQWEFGKVNLCEIRKYAILRGLCHKVMDVHQSIEIPRMISSYSWIHRNQMYALFFRWVLNWLPETLIWILQILFRKKTLLAWYQCTR